jgi:hypothetical protein
MFSVSHYFIESRELRLLVSSREVGEVVQRGKERGERVCRGKRKENAFEARKRDRNKLNSSEGRSKARLNRRKLEKRKT